MSSKESPVHRVLDIKLCITTSEGPPSKGEYSISDFDYYSEFRKGKVSFTRSFDNLCFRLIFSSIYPI